MNPDLPPILTALAVVLLGLAILTADRPLAARLLTLAGTIVAGTVALVLLLT